MLDSLGKKILRKRADLWRRFQRRLNNLTARFREIWRWIEPVWPAAAVLALLVLVLNQLRHNYPGFGNIGQGIYIEAWGTVFDILVVGIILTFFTIRRDRRERIAR